MSFSLHSSTENLGGGRRSGSFGSNSSSRLSWPVMSSNASARPLSKNHWKESRWTAIRSGSGRASSMLAKDTRSGLRDRAGNGLPPVQVVTNETDNNRRLRGATPERKGTRGGQGRRRGARGRLPRSKTDQGLRTATL